MSILTNIQVELKAPKNQYNDFGGYKYRNCEDILEAVKPLLNKYSCSLIISDEIVLVGDRYYVKAKAMLYNEKNEIVGQATSYAREPQTVKGQSDAQITGASSSYARKYALNGLFCIDDTKDSDTTNTGESAPPQTAAKADRQPKQTKPMTLTEAQTLRAKQGDREITFKDLSDEQLAKLIGCGKKEWEEAAQLILEFRMKHPNVGDLPF